MKRAQNQFASIATLHLSAGAADMNASGPRAPHAGSGEQPLLRIDLRRSLHMHRRLAIGFALFGLTIGIVYLLAFWSTYRAQSLVYIQPTPPAVLEGIAPMHWPYNYDPATYDSYVQQQILSMTRPDVLVAALHKLEPGTWQQSGESDESAAERLGRAIEVARVDTSYQVGITAHASNPEMAAALANAVAASYIEDTSHEQKAADTGRLAMLRDERDRVKKELDDDRAEQAALNAQLGVAAIGPVAPEHYDDDIARIHEELVKARADHDEAAARLTSIAGPGPSSSGLDAAADQMISSDPGLSSLKQALLQRRAALVSQMANLTANHPQYQQDEAELQKIDVSIASASTDLRAQATARIEEELRTDLDRTAGLEARLNLQLAQMTRAAAGATPRLQRSNDLANDITRLQNRYNTVDEQLQNQLLEDSAPGTAHLAEAAVPPLHPSDAGVIRNAIALFFLFALLGMAAAVAAHKMDPRVYVAADVEHLLGFAPMAQLPDFGEVSEGVGGELALRLASAIEYASSEAGLQKFLFTGTSVGTGATTVASRVKEALGMMGTTAVLVRAQGASVPGQRGSTTVKEAVPDAPYGRSAPALMQTALAEDGGPRENLILTDAPPLAVSAEAEYLARFCDATIVVIESGVTTRAELRATANRLHQLNVAAVGFVLNRIARSKADRAFRRCIAETEKHLRSRDDSSPRQAIPSLDFAEEAAHELAEMKTAPVVAAALHGSSVPAALPLWSAARERPAMAAVQAPAPLPKPAPPGSREWQEVQVLPEPGPEENADTPSWLAVSPVAADSDFSPWRTPPIGNWRAALSNGNGHPPAEAEAGESAPEERVDAPPSRLNSLRGLLLSADVKARIETSEFKSRPNGSATPVDAGESLLAPSAGLPQAGTNPAPDLEPPREFVPARPGGTRPRSSVPFLPPKAIPLVRAGRSGSSDDLQILPSRRGQYRRRRAN